MDTILFSIIVPCYNVQDYLDECVNSILAQTYECFEIILVDDGSTDSTPEVCDQLSALDKRVYVYHKENGGLSDARNYGMEKAKGDYLIFVDSDDFITEKALEYFASVVEKSHPDVLLTRLTEYYGDNDIVEQDAEMETFFRGGISVEKAMQWDMKKSKSTWPAPKKILSKRFADRYHLCFLKGFLHEDVDWTSRVMMYAETFDICVQPWYFHRMQRKESITNTMSPKRLTDVIKMASRLIYGDEMSSIVAWRREMISDRIMRSVYPILTYYGKLSREGKAEVVECCKTNKCIFQSAPDKRHKAFALCAHTFGFRIALGLLARLGGIV